MPDAGSDKSKENQEVKDERELVEYETYKKVLDQRKADQAKARDLQAQLDAIKAERETEDANKMAEQKRFQELYETEKKKREEIDGKLKANETEGLMRKKREALKAELGGVRKEEYLGFADLNSVSLLDDGTVDPESVKTVAAKFREAHPELIASKSSGSKLPSDAASGFQPPKDKPLHEMSAAELRALYVKTNTNSR